MREYGDAPANMSYNCSANLIILIDECNKTVDRKKTNAKINCI